MNNSSPDRNNENNYDFERARSERTTHQNPYATSYEVENSQRRTNYSSPSRQVSRKPVKRKKKLNIGAIAFTLIIIALLAFSIHQIIANSQKNKEKPDTPVINETLSDKDEGTVPDENDLTDENVEPDEIISESKLPDPVTVTVDNSMLDDGNLILVNYLYEYKDADNVKTVNCYNSRTTAFKVAGTDIDLSEVAFTPFEKMVKGLEKATGCDDMIINSGYRSFEGQVDVYDYYLETKGEDYAKQYVAVPGYSEHHTGLACDLSFFLDEGYSEPIGEHAHGPWITKNCTDYGFVIRYPSEKVEITGIAYEAWHFRYVGYPHAKAMTHFDYCLEEYIDALPSYTSDTEVLFVSEEGETSVKSLEDALRGKGYVIYYVPAKEGDTTPVDVYLTENDTYEISGTNVNGYVVTIDTRS